jgi:hypothetical protein
MSKDMLTGWWNRLQYLKNCHFKASNRYRVIHLWTGTPLVMFAALANAGLWAVLTDIFASSENLVKLGLAGLGTIITILSAVQAFLGFDKRSEMHKNAATRYSALSGEIDLFLNYPEKSKAEDFKLIMEKWGLITESAPLLPKKMATPNKMKPHPKIESQDEPNNSEST